MKVINNNYGVFFIFLVPCTSIFFLYTTTLYEAHDEVSILSQPKPKPGVNIVR
jgi:hypothetical protein